MGYHSTNRGDIYRDYDTRRIVVSAYDEELDRTETESFGWDELDRALDWLRQKLNAKSM